MLRAAMLARRCASLPSPASTVRRLASRHTPTGTRAAAQRLLALGEGSGAQRAQPSVSVAARGRVAEDFLESLALEPLFSSTTLRLVGGGLAICAYAGLRSDAKCVSDDDAGEEDDALKSKHCITGLYEYKYCIAARIFKFAMWDKHDELKSWCIDACHAAYCQELWRLRTESAALDGTDAMVRARGLSMAYDHTEHTLSVIADGDWKDDATKVQFAETAVKYYALGFVDFLGNDAVSLRGAVQTSIEEYWDLFHRVPALFQGAPPKMPFDAAHLILDATYTALGNEDLLQHVDLETITKACCRTGNSTETKMVVDHVLEGTEEAYWRASRLFRPLMLAAETAGLALARVRPSIEALAAFCEAHASADDAPLALASDAVLAPGAAGVVNVAAPSLETAFADAFVDAFVGRDDVTRDEVLAGLRACLAAVERFDEPPAALLDALRNDISRAALAPGVAADAVAFPDIASTREPDVLEAAREALGRVALGVDDGSGGGALAFLRGELAHQTSALDQAVADGQRFLYGETGNGYGGDRRDGGGSTICRLRDAVNWEAMDVRDDIDRRAATLSGCDRGHIARTLRASSDAYHLVYEVAPLTMGGFVVDKQPAFAISCVVRAADANVNSWDSLPRHYLETDAAHMLAAMRLKLHSMHSGGAPISLDAAGVTVDYLGREVYRLFRKTPLPSALTCRGAVLRMGMGCKTHVALVDGDRYDVYGRGKNHFGLPAYFPWKSSGCGDVELHWSATVGTGAVDAVFNRATGLTADGLQGVYDGAVETLPWREDWYSPADALCCVTVVRPDDWHPVTSVEGSGVIEGSVIVRDLRMDVAVANAGAGGFFAQAIAEALGLVPGAVAVVVENAAIVADVEQLRAVPRGSNVLAGRVDSLEVAMVGGGTPLEALTHVLDVHYALEEAESDEVKYASRLAGFKESCAEALDAAEVGESSKFLLLGEDRVGPNSRAAVVGRPCRPMVVGIKLNTQQSAIRIGPRKGATSPHACCVIAEEVLPTLARAAEAGASFTASDGSHIGKLSIAKVDLVLVPNDFTILEPKTIKSKDTGDMRKGARYLYMTYVGALLDSDVSFDNQELRRHHAFFKPRGGNWNGPFRDGNAWTWPGPPTEPYPPGFGES